MSKKLNCILLVDDNPHDNFYHERVIRKSDSAEMVVTKTTGKEALEYLKSTECTNDCGPELIFLDINMPGMNGWEFLREYEQLDIESKRHVIIVMLTTSDNIDDHVKAKKWSGVADFKTKPLSKEMLAEILEQHFK